jgi:hypothetical protein
LMIWSEQTAGHEGSTSQMGGGPDGARFGIGPMAACRLHGPTSWFSTVAQRVLFELPQAAICHSACRAARSAPDI